MKTLSLSFVLLILSATTSFAQYCGNSGPTQCTPSGTLPPGSFTPNEDIPCIERGQQVNTIIEFTCYNTVSFSGQLLTFQSLRIDSISNLPPGLCWSTNSANNTFSNSQSGCIRISGVTYFTPGQYKLNIIFTANVGFMMTVNGDAAGMKVFLRLIDPAAAICPPVDTTQTSANDLIPYNGLYSNVAEVKGKMFFDANQNQVFDNGEQPVKNQLLSLGNGDMAFTNQSGNYTAYTSPGALTIKPFLSGNLAGFAFKPDSIDLVVDSAVSYANNDFGIIAPPNFCESTISIVTQNPPPRPGFNNSAAVHFTNVISSVALTPQVSFRYDAHQTFLSATPALASIDTANRLLIWNTGSINSGGNWQGVVTLRTPQTVALGTVLTYTAWVSNSACAQSPVPQSDQQSIVVGSYDPNDKAVSPIGEGPDGRILPSTSQLSYTIRFQNTGTYLAENVNVVDTISPYLNISTLRVEAASHLHEVIIRGREVTFRFNQINLPDSNANEPMSHGYIKYSIQPSAGFVQNTVVQNRADIYFDFNSPILTNTTINTADNFVGMAKVSEGNISFRVYPNPVSDGNWQIEVDREAIGSEMKIYDAQGRTVHMQLLTNVTSLIDASNLSKGVYVIRIGNAASRIVKL